MEDLRAALVEDAMQKFTDVNQEIEAALAEPWPAGVVTSMVKGGVTWHIWPDQMADGTTLYAAAPIIPPEIKDDKETRPLPWKGLTEEEHTYYKACGFVGVKAVEEKLRARNSTLACIPAVPPRLEDTEEKIRL
jgi:hypothetical protein